MTLVMGYSFRQNLSIFDHLYSGLNLFLKPSKNITLAKVGQGLETLMCVFRIYFPKQIIHVYLYLYI